MYYKGNTIGLNYDAATGNWSFSNEPNDFIDTNAFSTSDPKFDFVPPSNTTPDEPENDPCPAGYKYDSTLKQCVIDPDYQNPFMDEQAQTTGGGGDTTPVRIAGTDRTTTDGNFIASDDEYNKMSASELIENYKQRGFVKLNDKGQLVLDLNRVQRKGGVLDVLLGRMGKEQVEGQASLDKVVNYLVDKNIVNRGDIYVTDERGGTGNYTFNSEVIIPTIEKFEADYYGIPYSDVIAPGFGNKIFGTKESVQQFDDFMAQKLAAFSIVANNAVSNYKRGDLEYQLKEQESAQQESAEKARKAKADADRAEAEKERKQLQLIEERKAQEEKEERRRRQEEFEKSGGDITQRRKEEEKRKSDFVKQQQETRGKSKSEAERDYVRQQAARISSSNRSQFKKDTARTPSGKSYTQSKIEQAAKTGRYSGF